MSKAVNLLLTFLIVPTVCLALFVGTDLNALGFIKGLETSFAFEIFLAIGILSGILFVWRAFRRWMAFRILSNPDQFIWVGSASQKHIKRMRLYFVLEAVFFICLAVYFFLISDLTIVLAVVFALAALENLIFLVLRCNTKFMKAGISKNGLVLANRDLSFFYFSGLIRVSPQNDSIYMEYRNGLCLSFPLDAVKIQERVEFLQHFVNAVDKKNVFVSEKLRI
jgi:hypothetical protein